MLDKRAFELYRNMPQCDKDFLNTLLHQHFPGRPYDYNAPYKKIRYMLNKYIELGVLELNDYGFKCEITTNFTPFGLKIIEYIGGYNVN